MSRTSASGNLGVTHLHSVLGHWIEYRAIVLLMMVAKVSSTPMKALDTSMKASGG